MSRRSPTQRLRQHHALEHATISVLSREQPLARIVARSDLQGFIVYGDVDTNALRRAAEKALELLQRGESGLAVHPNCGTNLVAAGTLSGLAALLAAAGRRRSIWDRLPSAILGATAALMLAQPFGTWLQANVTTSSEVAGVELASVERLKDSAVTRHRVKFR